ncbi:MAG: hypothetical protein N4A38_05870 [Candidatus Gracilibacteria bacterium]|nr:hypothetical protein [Candidatus Gracilibacteria bacterium]
METKTISKILCGLAIFSIVFLGLYYGSEDFRVIIKGIKHGDNSNKIEVTDEIKIPENNVSVELPKIEKAEPAVIENISETPNNSENNSEDNAVIETKIISDSEQSFLDKFNEYSLTHNDIALPLFGVLRDFSSPYETYSNDSGDLTIYFFGKYDYNALKTYFSDRKEVINMSVNEVNNFGDNSFYLNSDGNNTGKTRIILKLGEHAYAVEVNKKNYNNIKTILLNLK